MTPTLTAYLLGLLTLPALALLFSLLLIGWAKALRWMATHDWFVEVTTNRDPDRIPDWRLRDEIWFETGWGPLYWGHWCRDDCYLSVIEGRTETTVTHWVGVGPRVGRSLMMGRERVLASDHGSPR